MNKVKISVVVPAYNAEKYIKRCLFSIISQTYLPNEVIVIDDGSTDNTSFIIKKFFPFVKLIRTSRVGVSKARNIGLDKSSSLWVAFLDADDWWMPHKLMSQAKIISAYNDVVCVHSNYFLYINGSLKKPSLSINKYGLQHYSIAELLLNPIVNTSTALIRKDLNIFFPEWATQAEDMLFFTELSKYGKFYYDSSYLAVYRMHPNQSTKKIDSWLLNIKNRFKWLQTNSFLSEKEKKEIELQLKNQLIEWIKLAKWNRQWSRYYYLKEYALSLDWSDDVPKILNEKLLPKPFYKLKDIIDKVSKKIFYK